MQLNISSRIHVRTFGNSVQPLVQEDIEAFLGYTGTGGHEIKFCRLKAAESTLRIYAASVFIDLDLCL